MSQGGSAAGKPAEGSAVAVLKQDEGLGATLRDAEAETLDAVVPVVALAFFWHFQRTD